ncbi:MAG: kinase [Thermoleophilaceae bacterium]|nr:kinase [Thermoleophilaceae bacterium]
MKRIGLVVHPSREIGRPLSTLTEWASRHDVEVVQLAARDSARVVAPFGDVSACDLVVAIGGDGTVLTALRAAAPLATPVLGVACGSLGALIAVTAPQVEDALDRFEAGSWSRRELPALETSADGQKVAWSINDFVLVRRNMGQLIVDVTVGDELYARMAGDGVIVATALGSSAYSMAAGGPILVDGTGALLVTPLVIHGGSAPPLIVRAGVDVTLEAHPGYGGFDIEVDGHLQDIDAVRFVVRLVEARATLVSLGDPGLGLNALRRRGLITDSPRVLARGERASES